MNVTIVGAGAIGLLFSARLAIQGHHVCLITHYQEQADEINKRGITLIGEQNQTVSVLATHNPDNGFKDGVWIVTLKQYQLEMAYSMFMQIPQDAAVIFTQNGMSHLALLERLPHSNLFVSTVEHGACKQSNTSVKHNGIGAWKIAAFRGLHSLADSLDLDQDRFFPILFHPDYETLLLEKLIKNIMINPMTAILNVRNGELIKNPYIYRTMEQLYNEVACVFPAARSIVPFEEVVLLCQRTSENISSMNADLRSKRQTEIDAIVGYAIEKGNGKEELPLLRFLYDAIRGQEYTIGVRS
ncbi:2-dehydropantoate 2-reductase [Jeotgalibacillus soli]|uniref:2-dehydropantoate 2-reductase n=1 Tax=Jeotgalibacillus soli TaxID=889306 RepID=A0A0C2RSP3_9BACL|nr:2-dehydropantoate 2-reductase [Jeotgalibacillus soli]KIL44784.1 2-dehydropantoate 2-reductase [Jeotgalibacillus soli]